jgi:hypothetical protein
MLPLVSSDFCAILFIEAATILQQKNSMTKRSWLRHYRFSHALRRFDTRGTACDLKITLNVGSFVAANRRRSNAAVVVDCMLRLNLHVVARAFMPESNSEILVTLFGVSSPPSALILHLHHLLYSWNNSTALTIQDKEQTALFKDPVRTAL